MTSPKKKADLEAKMRRQYMRMKMVNDIENNKLANTIAELNRNIVSSMEQHVSDNQNVMDMWRRCSTTTGWYDEAVKPRRRDMRSAVMVDFKKKTKPWAYSTQDTIEKWAERKQTVPRSLVDSRVSKKSSRHINKSTVEQERCTDSQRQITKQEEEDEDTCDSDDSGDINPLSPVFKSRAQTVMKQHQGQPPTAEDVEIAQRVKSARGFNNLNLLSSFQSPRLDDKHVKCNVILRPSTTATSSMRNRNSVKDKQTSSKRRQASKSAAPIRSRETYGSHVDDKEEDDVFGDDVIDGKIAIKSNNIRVITLFIILYFLL